MSLPAPVQFKYPWRGYQQRILDELSAHLANDHLHVVAPPGSGKTVLGLEVLCRLGQPALVLAPTLTIRDQWVERFCELFLADATRPVWLSTDLHQPAWLTISTYQALHAACAEPAADAADAGSTKASHTGQRARGPAALVQRLRAQKLGTLVLDEAHHLQNAWWRSLMQVKEQLAPTVVSLTATPPYDVSAVEWERYCDLNGPVDAEITVAELVAAGDLCPHQDYVCFSEPTGTEGQQLQQLHHLLQAEYEALRQDLALGAALASHPALQAPLSHLDWVYGQLPSFAASLILLHSQGQPLHPDQLAVLGVAPTQVPPLTPEWLEKAVQFYLFEDGFEVAHHAHRQALEKRLRQHELLQGKRLTLRFHPQLDQLLGTSLSKLHAIGQIVEFEQAALGPALRLVVLTDYIRREFMPATPTNELPLNRLGVLPVFELLRRQPVPGQRLGVLTGSVVVLPTAALPALQAAAPHQPPLPARPLPYDAAYSLLLPPANRQTEVVGLVTKLFEQGHITTLIGTKALLGEGWDAPCLNTLLLASFVGSFVQSNQMRGRAIRTDPARPAKASHIWHLACLDAYAASGGPDLELLQRRFRVFVGVTLPPRPPALAEGLARLGLPRRAGQLDRVPAPDVPTAEASAAAPPSAQTLNAPTFSHAADRPALVERWRTALKTGSQLVPQLHVRPTVNLPESLPRLRRMSLQRTLAYLLAELGAAVALFASETLTSLLRSLRPGHSWAELLLFLKIAAVTALVVFGRRLWRALRLYLTYRDIGRDVEPIARALLAALRQAGLVQGGADLETVVEPAPDGSVTCYLRGGSTHETSLFLRTLAEVLDPLDNPRYVLERQSTLWQLIAQRDYHAVPEVLGRTKKEAETYARFWRQYVGPCHLLYTRTLEGREQLLQVRGRTLAAALAPRAKPRSRWQ
ncbi:DEAD/DEAH box helicase family protein [Hymenobacter aerophilus]|uniref:DEAD/DEAH box helicase family protein n=1 Tax=Hymenobacter aerophilus TaxID=119644 RepID=UPI00036087F4|nr:DEAD/DEAH box helicase family protein [Hymenobacter aerophilus]